MGHWGRCFQTGWGRGGSCGSGAGGGIESKRPDALAGSMGPRLHTARIGQRAGKQEVANEQGSGEELPQQR